MTLKTLFEQLGEAHAMPKKQLSLMAAELVSTITAQLAQGTRIRMAGLGTLEVKQRPARTGRNPATGAPMPIAASRKVAFRPAKELKEAI
jgi:DNA-binding protein HU-beta